MKDYRGFFPGIFTMGNVICGFFSILSSFEGQYTEAAWFVVLAGFLDALDGKVARLSGSTSQFGVELDSLADFLSFGVAPAVLVYSIKLNSLGKWGWIISIIFITSAAYRLARYNLLADSEEKGDFLGLPVPAAAFGLVSFIILSDTLWGGLHYSEILLSMLFLFSFLMISQVQYDSIPDQFVTKSERIKLGFLIIGVIALLVRPRELLFPTISLYILFGLIREAYRLLYLGVGKMKSRPSNRKRRQGDIIDDDE